VLRLGATALLTGVAIGAGCWWAWGFFWSALLWTFGTLVVFGLVAAGLNWLLPPADPLAVE
jgi:hypothetical protein